MVSELSTARAHSKNGFKMLSNLLKLRSDYKLNITDLSNHIKNYKVFLIENGFLETIRACIVEIYFWFCLTMCRCSEQKAFMVNGFIFHIVPHDIGISAELKVFGNHEPLSSALLSKF